jgi:AraC-like DNA-binding protein
MTGDRPRPPPVPAPPTPKPRAPLRPRGFAEIKSVMTRDIGEARALVQSLFGPEADVESLGGDIPLAMDALFVALGDARLVRARLADCRVSRPLKDLAHIVLPVDGSLTYSSGARSVTAQAGQRAAVGRPFETTVLEARRADYLGFLAPIDTLAEYAERLTGQPCDRSLIDEMPDAIDLASPLTQVLARTLKSAMLDTVRLGAVGIGGLALDGYEDLLLKMAASALFPRLATHMSPSPPDCGAPVFRRARKHIAAHACEAIELSRLAKKLGLSMRAMQAGFQRYYRCSPRDYIIECRLERARSLLVQADAATSVTQIALACGFGDLSHFSAKYHDKYGELPSETIRGAVRRTPST